MNNINAPQEFLSCHVHTHSKGIEVNIKIPEQRFVCMTDRGDVIGS
jgi:FdhD protein